HNFGVGRRSPPLGRGRGAAGDAGPVHAERGRRRDRVRPGLGGGAVIGWHAEAARAPRRRFFVRAEDGIRGRNVTGVQTCALPISFFVVDVPASNSKVQPPVVSKVPFDSPRNLVDSSNGHARVGRDGSLINSFDRSRILSP